MSNNFNIALNIKKYKILDAVYCPPFNLKTKGRVDSYLLIRYIEYNVSAPNIVESADDPIIYTLIFCISEIISQYPSSMSLI